MCHLQLLGTTWIICYLESRYQKKTILSIVILILNLPDLSDLDLTPNSGSTPNNNYMHKELNSTLIRIRRNKISTVSACSSILHRPNHTERSESSPPSSSLGNPSASRSASFSTLRPSINMSGSSAVSFWYASRSSLLMVVRRVWLSVSF